MDEGVLRLTSRDLGQEEEGEAQAKNSRLDISIATLHQAENKVGARPVPVSHLTVKLVDNWLGWLFGK